jgi:hypothetical protein
VISVAISAVVPNKNKTLNVPPFPCVKGKELVFIPKNPTMRLSGKNIPDNRVNT